MTQEELAYQCWKKIVELGLGGRLEISIIATKKAYCKTEKRNWRFK